MRQSAGPASACRLSLLPLSMRQERSILGVEQRWSRTSPAVLPPSLWPTLGASACLCNPLQVLWGRSVFTNIRKFLQFQLTINLVALIVAFVAVSCRLC